MIKYYKDYRWKNGKPEGLNPFEEIGLESCYKIVSDPYFKRITIEKYVKGQFSQVIYDSIFLDFRTLRQPELTAWQKVSLSEAPEKMVCLIRNQDDRVLYLETYYFERQLCRECHVEAPQGIPLSIHKMFYSHQGDPFDGVILFDYNNHPVMIKKYLFDEKLQQFTTLLEENWVLDYAKSGLFENGFNNRGS